MSSSHLEELSRLAQALPRSTRESILREIREIDLHPYLRSMLAAMQPNAIVEVTHGPTEMGKDLVVISDDSISTRVIAFVVKKGDISGQTAGDVDEVSNRVAAAREGTQNRAFREIQSQIRQARAHPAEVKTMLATLRVEKVIVVLVGNISNNARRRLTEELNQGVECWDLQELVTKFTENYPQFFFDAKAIDHLTQLVLKLEEDNILSKKGKTLSQCYIEPVVAPLNRGITFDEGQYALHLASNKLRIGALFERVERGARCLLLGDPGSGKSKTLAKLCLDRYRAAMQELTRSRGESELIPIPAFITAQELASTGDAGVLLQSTIPNELVGRFRLSSLLLDGLDEIPAEKRVPILEVAAKAASDAGAGLLVSSRKLAMLNSSNVQFSAFELLPLGMGQALKMIEKVAGDLSSYSSVQEGLAKLGSQLPLCPLSVLMLMELVVERKEIPASVGELYDRYIDISLGRYDVEKGIEVLFAYQVKRKFLQALAFDLFFSKDELEISRGEFDQYLERHASTYGFQRDLLSQFVAEVERSGLITVSTDEVYFRHRSFLEYFVASQIDDRREGPERTNNLIATSYVNDLWSEVAFYFVASRRELQKDLLEAIVTQCDTVALPAWSRVLGGRLLQAGWHSTVEVKTAGVRLVLGSLAEARDQYRQLVESTSKQVPMVFLDVVVLLMAEWSLGSVFLRDELASELARIQSEPIAGAEQAQIELALVSLLGKLSSNEQKQDLDQALTARLIAAKIGPETETSMLALLSASAGKASPLVKKIRKRLRALIREAPAVIGRVLPGNRSRIPYPRVPGSK